MSKPSVLDIDNTIAIAAIQRLDILSCRVNLNLSVIGVFQVD